MKHLKVKIKLKLIKWIFLKKMEFFASDYKVVGTIMGFMHKVNRLIQSVFGN
jgi:hypothetical protein